MTTVVPFLAESLNMRIAGRTSHLRHGLDYGNLLLTKVEPREVQPLDLAVPGREPRAATAADIELHGVRVPAWLIHNGSDVSALALLGLLEYYQVEPNSRTRQLVANLAVVVDKLDRTFLRELEDAVGPAPEWLQPGL